MGKSRKNKASGNRKGSYYDDSDYNNPNQKLKKSKHTDSRKDKNIEKGIFIDWDSI